jgi:hypothetical protein
MAAEGTGYENLAHQPQCRCITSSELEDWPGPRAAVRAHRLSTSCNSGSRSMLWALASAVLYSSKKSPCLLAGKNCKIFAGPQEGVESGAGSLISEF